MVDAAIQAQELPGAVGGRQAATPDDGRIPFRVRLAVTGHRDLEADVHHSLWGALDGLLRRLRASVAPGDATELRLAVVSQLAEGADRMAVEWIFEYAHRHDQDARLEVVLPMEHAQYAEVQQFSAESRQEFERLLAQSSSCIEPPASRLDTPERRAAAYTAAGRTMIDRCDVLIALWDGSPAASAGEDPHTAKRGGTAHTLLTAAAHGKACIWIPTADGLEARDNFEEGSGWDFLQDIRTRSALAPDDEPAREQLRVSALEPVRRDLRAVDEYNREPRIRHLARRCDSFVASRTEQQLEQGAPPWLAAPMARAGVLAEHYQRWFRRLVRLVLAAATLAAGVLSVAIALRSESAVWPAVEVGLLAAAFAAFIALKRLHFHARWLSYRVLAEWFRTARYIAPTGIDFRDHARMQSVWVENWSENWIMRTFEEVWDRGAKRAEPGQTDTLRKFLISEWIEGQISYHAIAGARHERAKRMLTRVVYGAFALTLLMAGVDLLFAAAHTGPSLLSTARALSVFLPVAGASIGIALTIGQHHALAERSRRMEGDLREVKEAFALAVDQEGFKAATIKAASVITPETGTWFGALWFLDIEHP